MAHIQINSFKFLTECLLQKLYRITFRALESGDAYKHFYLKYDFLFNCNEKV